MSPSDAKTAPEPSDEIVERAELRSLSLSAALLWPFADGSAPATTAPRRGYALDESASGFCLQLEAPVAVGEAFRVELRDADAPGGRSEIARAVWCSARRGGRFNAGFQILTAREAREGLLHVEHDRRRAAVSVQSAEGSE